MQKKMSDTTKDGGQAFPHYLQGRPGDEPILQGMSLRDYFAGASLKGHLSNTKTTEHPSFDRESLAYECYQMADAMLKAREEK